MRYASQTTVSTDKSRTEIERTLTRYGAESFAYGWENNVVVIAFKLEGKTIRFSLPMPEREDHEETPTGRERTERQIDAAIEQAQRQRFRALALAIKAKLEMVESGITTFEEEFLAHIVLPDGKTVGQWMSPQLDKINTKMPPLLKA